MFEGKEVWKGRSMLRPFWIRTMIVWEGLMAGAIWVGRDGGMSA